MEALEYNPYSVTDGIFSLHVFINIIVACLPDFNKLHRQKRVPLQECGVRGSVAS